MYALTFTVFAYGLTQRYLLKVGTVVELKITFFALKKRFPELAFLTPMDMYSLVFWQVVAMSQLKVAPKIWDYRSALIYLNLLVLLALIVLLAYVAPKLTKDKMEMHLMFLILLLFFVSMASVFYIKTYFGLFLGLELFGVIYYFFFLHNLSTGNLTAIRYKNLLSNYLWMSFFLLVILVVFLYYVVYRFGTLDFEELICVNRKTPEIWHFIVLIALWKLGAPGFHFFKLELYQYLPLYTLLIFSVVSIFVNGFILQFLVTHIWPILVTHRNYFLIYVLIVNSVLLMQNLFTTSFYQFLGLSTLNTITMFLMFFLI